MVVGERGLRLSGGERQRLGFARALLRRAPILVLDESTAQLDAITEAALVSCVAALRGRRGGGGEHGGGGGEEQAKEAAFSRGGGGEAVAQLPPYLPTLIIIAHRLPTVESADCIIVLGGGGDGNGSNGKTGSGGSGSSSIVERGSHRELLRAGGVYAAMHAEWSKTDGDAGVGVGAVVGAAATASM